MNKLLTALFAGAMLLTSGALLAADPAGAGRDNSTQPGASQTMPGETQPGDMKEHPATPPARSAKDNPRDPDAVYSAELLKKCDSMRGSKKQECIAAAKKKSGEM